MRLPYASARQTVGSQPGTTSPFIHTALVFSALRRSSDLGFAAGVGAESPKIDDTGGAASWSKIEALGIGAAGSIPKIELSKGRASGVGTRVDRTLRAMP